MLVILGHRLVLLIAEFTIEGFEHCCDFSLDCRLLSYLILG